MLVKIAKYIGFCVYRRPYLLWSPVIARYTAMVEAKMLTDKNMPASTVSIVILGQNRSIAVQPSTRDQKLNNAWSWAWRQLSRGVRGVLYYIFQYLEKALHIGQISIPTLRPRYFWADQLWRGAILLINRAYGAHKNLHISLFLPTAFGPIYFAPP